MVDNAVREEGARLASLVAERRFTELHGVLEGLEPPQIAEIISELGEQNEAVVFRLLPRELATQTFEYLPVDTQEGLLKALGDEAVAAILNDISPDDRTAFFEELPGKATRRLLNLLSPSERTVASRLLGYPEDSIGRLMTPDYVAIKEHWTVEQVLEHIRRYGRDSETLNVLYVVGEGGKLIDDLRMREILLASPDTQVAALMDRQFVALTATDDQETAIAVFRRYDRTTLPVTDTAGVLVGIVTVDDVLDVAEEEATEDFQKLGGTEVLGEPYLQASLPTMIRKRVGWLVLLFLSEMLTATVMGSFQAELAQALVLSIFIPLIISSGGNSGSQAATLIIRALAVGEVALRDWWRVMRREILSGLALGATLGAVGFARITVWELAFHSYGHDWLLVAFTIWLSLIGVVLWGSLSGSLLPLVIRRFGGDPAVSSAPFIATLVDVTGLLIYFSVASIILL